MPRTAAGQFAAGRSLAWSEIDAGDLVFFSTAAPGPSHVGIAISRSQFIHAPTSTGVVRLEQLADPYWTARVIGARRLH